MLGYYFDLALRSFRRNKVLTALMVLAIALGIGASMTTLTVFHVLSGDPLPGKSDRVFYPQMDPRSMSGYSEGEDPEFQMTRFDAEVYDPVDTADRLSARPDAAAPIYPVISMTAPSAHAGSRKNLIGEGASPALERAHTPSFNVPADAPPAFLLHAENDESVVVENTLMLRAALREQDIAVETHLYADGGHGFGLRLARGKTVEGWEHLFHRWGKGQGLWA